MFVGFWQYMYPGDHGRTCGYSLCWYTANGDLFDSTDDEIHTNTGIFTHCLPLPAPPTPKGGE